MVQQFIWLFFGLSGRIGSKPYVLAAALAYIARALPLYQLLRHPPGSEESNYWTMLFLTAVLVTFWVNIAITVKRLHDADKPGIIALVTIVLDLLAVIFFAFMKGTPGPNRYGSAPNQPR
jgi:uncharacterized membrane protein YhaH (DUF805 family)